MKNHLNVLFVLALVHGVCLAQPTPPTELGDRRELAKQLVSILQEDHSFRAYVSTLRNLVESKFPPSAKPAFQEIWNLGRWDWKALEDHSVTVYAEIFSEEELKTILAFFRTDAGRKWISATPVMMERMTSLVEGEAFVKVVAEVGCTLGFVLKTADMLKARARKDGIALDEGELILRTKPAIPSIANLCSCVMSKAANKWGGYANFQAMQETPEVRAWMRDVFETDCPFPRDKLLESIKSK